ncbi:MAG: hydrogenase maturation nickel metallochaperone HypA [Lewinellaceae bacterium]|nr:hydrogenase maturation nickel metallochaperone HypA [Phaeodactylibacter sp.]MCB0614069.1 hydrogenase maturation nickel metallochaperone HypA [Phaeodactylibacter sp.]MCB9349483.1 hydrogenase maturation nickel metallochaperone HypA [Lewinellaceae bacterium]
MHEISLARSILNTLEAEFSSEQLGQLTEIGLKVGLLSNVEPALMQNAFEAVTTTENRFQQAVLKIETVPIVIYCEACDARSTIANYKFACSSCGQPNNNIVSGTELLIHQVRFE